MRGYYYRGILFTSNVKALRIVRNYLVCAWNLHPHIFQILCIFFVYRMQECKHVHSDNTYYIQIVDLR